MYRPLLIAALVSAVAACDSSSAVSDAAAADTVADAASDAAPDSAPDPDAGPDALPDATPDTAPDATTPDADAGPTRDWRYRAIGGISMGAMAANIALRNPEVFDMVGALGGYIDLPYLVTTGLRLQLAGFCPLETLESHVEALDDIDADPPIFCGPVAPKEELEASQDFNHLHFDTNGATFDREFYLRVFQSLTMAFGNFTAEPTGESPYLPTGLDLEWLAQGSAKDRCDGTKKLPKELSYNAEYNPDAAYAVVPVCDSKKQALPGLGGADFDPTVPHTFPTDILLAVDINGNGVRDYGEPLFLNAFERYEDVGADGCRSAREDGAGGCLAEGAPDATAADPNGDDFHWWQNPEGTEGDSWREDGEPYGDLGLDGVAATSDPGEGNGQWDVTTAFARAREFDARTLARELPIEQLDAMDFYFDAGIRDPLHAAVGTRHVVGVIEERLGGVELRQGIVDRPNALLPSVTEGEIFTDLFEQDLSAAALGRHVYVEYGDPDATPEQIAAGDGGHVGTNFDALARLVTFIAVAASRFPDPDLSPGGNFPPSAWHHYYSEALGARRGYVIGLPPGYTEAENAAHRYPTLYFLHGLGQDAADLSPATFATATFMKNGDMPKVIVVFPDGACCDVHVPTGRRECACRKAANGMRECVDPQCKGPEETCEVRAIPSSELTEECNGGSLFFDLVTNRWGEPRSDLGYGSSVLEVVQEVDKHFRTRQADQSKP
ncbi:MAG: hypothetical protein H6744_05265 [Deltaproteobacteria bacterium]|nr:hypothetical protein [Deltaproteobacteria bacterium]MCB9786087.1 hypothetical protein [Deltaproteobacteria bacterium]